MSLMYFHFQRKTIVSFSNELMKILCFMYRAFAVWEVCREDEFSPLKNGTGTKDTAETCRRDLILQHIRYLRKAGAEFRYEFSFNKKQCSC